MAKSDIQAICSQLLTPDDLAVDDKLFEQVLKEKIVTKILENKKSKYVKIFSKEQIFLSHITPLLHNIGFEIIDEVTYNVANNNELIYISRFNLNVEDFDKIEKAQDNLESIINYSLKDTTVKHSRAYSLVYKENLDLRKIMLIRAFIEYIDQAVLTINSATILNTLTINHKLACMFVKYFITKFDPKQENRNAILK
jgi:glutamate dehydrogenase